MKKALIGYSLLSVIVSTQAFAFNCPNLKGNYSCTLADYPTVHEDMNIDQTTGALSIDADKFIVDGRPHLGAFGIKYLIQCDGNSLFFRVAGLLGQKATVIYRPVAIGKLIVTRTESSDAQAKLFKVCKRK